MSRAVDIHSSYYIHGIDVTDHKYFNFDYTFDFESYNLIC